MTKFLISFPASAMRVPSEELSAVGEAARSVIREAKSAGIYVFAGGIDTGIPPVMVRPDGVTVNDLSVYTVIEQSTLSRTLDTLEGQGLVRREQGVTDSRIRHVFLTDDGRALFTRAWPAMHDAFEAMFDGVDDAEYAALIAILQKMLKNIRKHDI